MNNLEDKVLSTVVGGFSQLPATPDYGVDPISQMELDEWRDRLRDEASAPRDI